MVYGASIRKRGAVDKDKESVKQMEKNQKLHKVAASKQLEEIRNCEAVIQVGSGWGLRSAGFLQQVHRTAPRLLVLVRAALCPGLSSKKWTHITDPRKMSAESRWLLAPFTQPSSCCFSHN